MPTRPEANCGTAKRKACASRAQRRWSALATVSQLLKLPGANAHQGEWHRWRTNILGLPGLVEGGRNPKRPDVVTFCLKYAWVFVAGITFMFQFVPRPVEASCETIDRVGPSSQKGCHGLSEVYLGRSRRKRRWITFATPTYAKVKTWCGSCEKISAT